MNPKPQTLPPGSPLPTDVSSDQPEDQAKILAALAEAEADIREGRTVPHEEAKRRLAQWTSS